MTEWDREYLNTAWSSWLKSWIKILICFFLFFLFIFLQIITYTRFTRFQKTKNLTHLTHFHRGLRHWSCSKIERSVLRIMSCEFVVHINVYEVFRSYRVIAFYSDSLIDSVSIFAIGKWSICIFRDATKGAIHSPETSSIDFWHWSLFWKKNQYLQLVSSN